MPQRNRVAVAIIISVGLGILSFLLLVSDIGVFADDPDNTIIFGLNSGCSNLTIGERFNITGYLNPDGEQITAWQVLSLTYNTPAKRANCTTGIIIDNETWTFSEFAGIDNEAGQITRIQGFGPIGITNNSSLFEAEYLSNDVGSFTLKLNTTNIQNVDSEWISGYTTINQTVTVHPGEPMNLLVNVQDVLYHNLSWSIPPDLGIDETILLYNTEHTPISYSDGTVLYSGSNNWYNHTTFPDNDTFYYAIWGFNNTESLYSINSTIKTVNRIINNPPQLHLEINQTTFMIGQEVRISWACTDYHGLQNSSLLILNETNAVIYADYSENSTFNLNTINLSEGIYIIYLNATDIYGESNTTSETFNLLAAEEFLNVTSNTGYYLLEQTMYLNGTYINASGTKNGRTIGISIAPQGGGPALYNGQTITDVNGFYTHNVTLSSYFSTLGIYIITVQVSGTSTSNTTIVNITDNIPDAPMLSNETPAHLGINVSIILENVSVIISDMDGDMMDWNITVSIGDSAEGSGVGNSTISCPVSTPLDYETEISWSINVTDGLLWTNETYSFTTRARYTPTSPTGFTAETYNKTQINLSWNAPSTGADRIIIRFNESGPAPINRTEGYEICNISATNQSYNAREFTSNTLYNFTAWYYNTTDNTYSSSVSVANTTVTNSLPTISSPDPVNESTDVALSFNRVQANISDIDNEELTWNITVSTGDSNNGTLNGSDTITCDLSTPLTANTTIYWYVNITDGTVWVNKSYWFNTSDSIAITITNPYPMNQSTNVGRPPANMSADVTGSHLDVYIYFLNMTPATDVWTEISHWNNVNTSRFEYNLTGLPNTRFIWGNTTYQWSVNVTDGSSWVNRSFEYATTEICGGTNARFDVDNNGLVDVFDLNVAWANRDGAASYDGLYDVDNNGIIDVFDLNLMWANRS